ncbi:unnamed protein product [Calypogeia fissa]
MTGSHINCTLQKPAVSLELDADLEADNIFLRKKIRPSPPAPPNSMHCLAYPAISKGWLVEDKLQISKISRRFKSGSMMQFGDAKLLYTSHDFGKVCKNVKCGINVWMNFLPP